MSAWRSLRRFTLPAPGSPEFTPALAAAALVGLLCLQAALPMRTELPPDLGLAPRHARAPSVPPLAAYPALERRDVFSPGGTGGAGDGGGGSLESRQVVGVLMIGRNVGALLKAPGATAELVHAGQVIDGWRIARIDHEAVTFERGRERRRLVVGAPPIAANGPNISTASAPQGAETTP